MYGQLGVLLGNLFWRANVQACLDLELFVSE